MFFSQFSSTKSHLKDLCKSSEQKKLQALAKNDLSNCFYNYFDAAKCFEWLLRLVEGKAFSGDLIGEGYHFKTYLLPASSGALKLAMSVGKENFVKGLTSQGERWQKALLRARALDCALIPPMEVLALDQTYAYVMPYAEAPLTAAASIWMPLEKSLTELTETLHQNGLRLDDVAQIRCVKTTPIIVDWSDLNCLK